MDQLEKAIEERQERVRRLEKEVTQANELLVQAQQELYVLLAARQIVFKEQLLEHSSDDEAQLSLNAEERESPIRTKMMEHIIANDGVTVRLTENGTITRQRPREMTLVQEVIALLSTASSPMGPSQIRHELEKTGRIVPQNVMTGLLSRLVKEKRVARLERGQYWITLAEELH